MIGTLINVGTVLIGSTIGLLIRSRLPERYTKIMFQVFGLFTIFLGVKMALETQNIMVMIFSLLIGTLLGEWWNLEKGMDRFAGFIKKKIKSKNERFTEGFVTAFLVFCMGSLTILGAVEEGLGDKPNLLLTKSLMDGFSSMALASALGVGVMLSVVPLLIYQGGLTIFASQLTVVLSPDVIAELSAVGGILLIGLGFVLLEIKKVRIMNMLPSLIVVVFLATWLPPLLEKLF
jgi:uncharacterized membrane protein YqgA involved in biofilm formation